MSFQNKILTCKRKQREKKEIHGAPSHMITGMIHAIHLSTLYAVARNLQPTSPLKIDARKE